MNAFRKAALATAGVALAGGLLATAPAATAAPAAPTGGIQIGGGMSEGQITGTLTADFGDYFDPAQIQAIADQLAGSFDPAQLQQLAEQFQAAVQKGLDPAVLTDAIQQGADAFEQAGLPAHAIADPLIAAMKAAAAGQLPYSSLADVVDTITTGLSEAGVPITPTVVTSTFEAVLAKGVSTEGLMVIIQTVTDSLKQGAAQFGAPEQMQALADQLPALVSTVLDELTADGTVNPSDAGSEVVDGIQKWSDQFGMKGAEWNTWADDAGVQVDNTLNSGAQGLYGLFTSELSLG